jgi:ATP-binding cassette, subfamily B, multidrug efflux pump
MIWISPLLALVAIVSVPLSIFTMRSIGKRSKARFLSQWTHTGLLNSQVEEAFTGHAIVKAFGRQREVEERFRQTNDELYKSSFAAQFTAGVIQPSMMFLGNLNWVLIAVLGGLQVTSGAMTIGDVQAFLQYTRQFAMPLTAMASMFNVLQSGVASAERVFDLLDAEEQSPDPAQPVRVPDPHGRVEFEHISFRYSPDTPLIEDLSLVAEPGHTVAIVGPTGAGKTTILNLLHRFYDPTEGAITFDGYDLRQVTLESLYRQIALVPQETILFGGTILENIRYGREDATEQEVFEASKAAHAHEFITAFPDGYRTIVGEKGINLSGGQRQRLAIARAILKNPRLLLLDEATSSLDTESERLVQEALARLMVDRTTFVVAHRLTTIQRADRILVINKGRLVEEGTHASLMEGKGLYHYLYTLRLAELPS